MNLPIDHTKTPVVAIIGAGVSGTLTAVHLLQSAQTPLQIYLIDRHGVFGRGVAYNPTQALALLNLSTNKVSIHPDKPRHFLDWLHHIGYREPNGQPATEESFVPRKIYGQYICHLLDEAEAAAAPDVRLTRCNNTAVDVEIGPDAVTIYLQTGAPLMADQLVLALGNFPPRHLPVVPPSMQHNPRYIHNPWSGLARPIPADDTVLTIGTGLTMIDVVLELEARGHRGQYHAISKRGLLPQPHRLSATVLPPPALDELPNTAVALARYVRRYVQQTAAAHQVSWHVAFDSLRPLLIPLWQRLPLAEKKRLFRHAQPYWDIHRHRMPPQAEAAINALCASGRLTIQAGRFAQFTELADGIRVQVARKNGQTQTLDVQWVVNCTGPNANYASLDDPLPRNLLRRGLIQPDPLQLGILASATGAVENEFAQGTPRLHTLGPLLKGVLWETTAVPEIRTQAAALAQTLLTAVANA